MTRPSPLLLRLRRSILGAWLAVAYALAVLATGLAPQPAQAHAGLEGALLCSGLSVPATGEEVPAPSGFGHCKGCPLSPIMAASDPLQQPDLLRLAVPVARMLPMQDGVRLQPACAPPQSRAPPAV